MRPFPSSLSAPLRKGTVLCALLGAGPLALALPGDPSAVLGRTRTGQAFHVRDLEALRDLDGVSFQPGADLSNASFVGRSLAGASLAGTNCRGARFAWVDLRTTRLADAMFEQADFTGATLLREDLERLQAQGVDLTFAFTDDPPSAQPWEGLGLAMPAPDGSKPEGGQAGDGMSLSFPDEDDGRWDMVNFARPVNQRVLSPPTSPIASAASHSPAGTVARPGGVPKGAALPATPGPVDHLDWLPGPQPMAGAEATGLGAPRPPWPMAGFGPLGPDLDGDGLDDDQDPALVEAPPPAGTPIPLGPRKPLPHARSASPWSGPAAHPLPSPAQLRAPATPPLEPAARQSAAAWMRGFSALKDFAGKHGHLEVGDQVWAGDIHLLSWKQSQKEKARKGKLAEDQLAALHTLPGMADWLGQPEPAAPPRPAAAPRRVPPPPHTPLGLLPGNRWILAKDFPGTTSLDGLKAAPNARLQGAQFAGKTLAGADLDGADCSGASFRGVDLRTTRLATTRLDRADFTHAILEPRTALDMLRRGVDLRHAIFRERLAGAPPSSSVTSPAASPAPSAAVSGPALQAAPPAGLKRKEAEVPADPEPRPAKAAKPELWVSMVQMLEAYAKAHGKPDPPQDYETEDGFRIGRWAQKQRERHQAQDATLPRDCVAALERLPGWHW